MLNSKYSGRNLCFFQICRLSDSQAGFVLGAALLGHFSDHRLRPVHHFQLFWYLGNFWGRRYSWTRDGWMAWSKLHHPCTPSQTALPPGSLCNRPVLALWRFSIQVSGGGQGELYVRRDPRQPLGRLCHRHHAQSGFPCVCLRYHRVCYSSVGSVGIVSGLDVLHATAGSSELHIFSETKLSVVSLLGSLRFSPGNALPAPAHHPRFDTLRPECH